MDHSIGKDLPPVSVESFENLPGRGLFATISSIEVVNLSFTLFELLTSIFHAYFDPTSLYE